MSLDVDRDSRLRRNLVTIPSRWTREQLEFLRFSFHPRPMPLPKPAPPGDRAPRPPMIKAYLSRARFSYRHSAISELFGVPGYGHGVKYEPPFPPPVDDMWNFVSPLPSLCSTMLPLRFCRRRRFAEVSCIVFSPRVTNPQKPHVAAYVDEGGIYRYQQMATVGPVKRRVNQPYIAALLIALAQSTFEGVDYVETSVLFSGNRKPWSDRSQPLREFHLYTAKIPVALLEFFRRPKAILPKYDPIAVSCVSIPVEPVETLRERIVQAMPDSHDLPEKGEEEGKAPDTPDTPRAES